MANTNSLYIITSINKQAKAYSVMFNIENILRVAMHNIMVQKIGIEYFNINIFPEYEYRELAGDKKINVIMKAKERKKSEKIYNLNLGYDYNYFWYLDYNILISLLEIFGNKYFNELFKNSKSKSDIILRLKNAAPIRNKIAHNRYISNIDLNDLESLSIILNNGLNNTYLHNYNELALNSLEELLSTFKSSFCNILDIIKNKRIIQHDMLRKLKSTFSAILEVNEIKKTKNDFEEILKIIESYNKLPRKPGRGKEIFDFIHQNGLIDKINLLLEKLVL